MDEIFIKPPLFVKHRVSFFKTKMLHAWQEKVSIFFFYMSRIKIAHKTHAIQDGGKSPGVTVLIFCFCFNNFCNRFSSLFMLLD